MVDDDGGCRHAGDHDACCDFDITITSSEHSLDMRIHDFKMSKTYLIMVAFAVNQVISPL